MPASGGTLTIRLSRGGKEVYSWVGHRRSVFVVNDDILYYADFSPQATGCFLVAQDLTSGKKLWKTRLRGIGPQKHFRYSNSINLFHDGNYLVVYGNEARGRYIELADPVTGKTVGHRLVQKDE